MFWLYHDRNDAGRRLAERLRDYAGRRDVLVLALPRGGVPVGREVAQALGAPLDVLVVHRLSAPNHGPTLGAIAPDGVVHVDEGVVRDLRLSQASVDSVVVPGRADRERRERLYRGGSPPLDVRGKTVIVVDDGMVTGAT